MSERLPPPLDPRRLERTRPDLVRRLLFLRSVRADARERLTQRLETAPAHAALVLSHQPLVVGALCPEIDTVILLRLPDALASELGPPVEQGALGSARRLVTLNRLSPIAEGFAEDIDPGEHRGLYGNVTPLLAELVAAEGSALTALRGEVPEEEWERCRREGLQLLGRGQPLRDGRPLRSGSPGQRGVNPLDVPQEAPEPARRKARWLLRLALLPILAFVGLYVTARIYLRHVPYTIPAQLKPPPAGADAALRRGLRMRYLGTAGWEISDGKTTIWVDPVPTRPTVSDLISGPLEPDPAVQKAMKLRYADAILVNHGHFDHVLDVPQLAKETGAIVVGTQSVLNLCESRGVAPEKLVLAEGKKTITIGTFSIRWYASSHGPVAGIENPMPGTVAKDAGQLWFWQFGQDGTRGYRLEANGSSVLVTAGGPLAPGKEYLNGGRLEQTGTYIIGLPGPNPPDANIQAALDEIQPERVIANHFDNFFHPLEDGIGLLPGVNLEEFGRKVAAMRPGTPFYVLDYGERIFVPPDGEAR